MRGLPPRRGDERPAQEQGREHSCDPQAHLERDQIADVAIRTDGDGAGRVQRHVRREGREHTQTLDRIGDGDVLVRGLGNGSTGR